MTKKGLLLTTVLMGALVLPALAQEQATPTAKPGTKTPAATQRQKNQQKRIARGVKSGELTPGETRRLEKEQAKIQADKKAAKADGTVTPEERAKLQKEQNKASRDIYRKKHNEKQRPKAQ